MGYIRKLMGVVGVLAAGWVIGENRRLAATEAAPPPLAYPQVLGLSHVAVKATDYEKSVAFYRDFLGFAEQGRLFYPTNGRRELVYLKVSDSQTIEIFDAANVTQVAGQLYQIAINVENAETMRVHLARRGFRMPPVVGRGQMKNANFIVRDPNGYIIEVVQYLPEGRMVLDRGKFLSDSRISDHIIAAGVTTQNLPETLRFYRDILGFTVMAEGESVGGERVLARLKIPDTGDFIEVNSDSKDVPPYFCLEVLAIERARAALERRRQLVSYDRAIKISSSSNGEFYFDVFDPDGLRVRLIEMQPNAQRFDIMTRQKDKR